MKLFIDGHIHFYDNFSPELFFKSAEKNFIKYNKDKNSANILVFTEGKQLDYFKYFSENLNIYSHIGYTFEKTGENTSLMVKKAGKALFYIISGRQIVTEENIEILSLASKEKIQDGKSAEFVINKLIKEKTPAVLAWGFGKWLFKREKVIKKLIEKFQSPYLLLGDNSARPVFWRTPMLYKLAIENNYKIINGSDPLPLNREENKPASYGFILSGDFDFQKPSESTIKLLISKKSDIEFFGKRDGFFNFFKRQFRMFLKKHL